MVVRVGPADGAGLFMGPALVALSDRRVEMEAGWEEVREEGGMVGWWVGRVQFGWAGQVG